jgi:hypothetical protein
MYAIYFAVALFWGNWTVSGWLVVSASAITSMMLMAVVGVAALFVGMRMATAGISVPAFFTDYRATRSQRAYIELILVLGVLGTRFQGVGGASRQIVLVLLDFVPLVAFVLMFQDFLAGRSTPLEKFLIALFLLVKTANGLAAGWLGSVVGLFIIVGLLYFQAHGRVPRFWLVALAVYVLFFQVGKEEFRVRYWWNQKVGVDSGGTLDRITDWVAISLQQWNTLYEHPSVEQLQKLMAPSVNRLSLLPLGAAVLERTPDSVPYQNGKLYSYMLVTLIPRALWPDKPSFNEANQFVQVSYGLTQTKDLDRTSISIGVLVEAYINFGWPGVVVIMFLMGVFFAVFQAIFLMPRSPVLFTAIGIAALPAFLAIESQLVQYLAGLSQQVFLAYCAFLPAMTRRSQSKANSAHPQNEVLAVSSR